MLKEFRAERSVGGVLLRLWYQAVSTDGSSVQRRQVSSAFGFRSSLCGLLLVRWTDFVVTSSVYRGVCLSRASATRTTESVGVMCDHVVVS